MHACLALLSSSCKCWDDGVGNVTQGIAGLRGKLLLLAELVLRYKLGLGSKLILRHKLSLWHKLSLLTKLCLKLVGLRKLCLYKLLSILNKLLSCLNELLSILCKLLSILQELLSILYEIVSTGSELTCHSLHYRPSILCQLVWNILNKLPWIWLELIKTGLGCLAWLRTKIVCHCIHNCILCSPHELANHFLK